MVGLTGGEKDTAAPVMIKAKPANMETNFKSKNIELAFNEYLQLKNPDEQIIIGPSAGLKLKTKLNGKKIALTIDGELKPNTTYSINFGESIADFTESNMLKDFSYVFSTGSKLDSISIRGQIKDAFKNEFLKDVIVGLYANTLNDSNIYLNKPDYYARTNAQGYYQIKNIKEGNYQVSALLEGNNNKKYDAEDEMIGFSPNMLALKNDTALSVIPIFKGIPSKVKIKDSNYTNKKIVLIFNQKVNKIKYQLIPNIQVDLVDKLNTDSLEIYLKEKSDSIKLIIDAENYHDTIILKNEKNKRKSLLGLEINNQKSINISHSEPLTILNKDSIYFKTDSIKYIPAKIKLSNNRKNITIDYDYLTGKKYILIIGDSVLKDFNNEYNKKIQYNVKLYNEESLGNIVITAKQSDQNYIYELISNDKVIARIITKEEKINFKNLNPGDYKLRIIQDDNNNNYWDSGDYLNKKQAEMVNYFPGNIKVRANWDLELSVKTK
jgi:uncharacterized protein (DUF2141 family)